MPITLDTAKHYFVTGAAGFIGSFVARRLLDLGAQVWGYDNMNGYYDPRLKEARLNELCAYENFKFFRNDLADDDALARAFEAAQPQIVINLAAQAGVRYSLQNPSAYVQSNLVGFVNVLEQCRCHQVEHLLYASSSSVYGSNKKLPFAVTDNVDHPISLYAATKKSNELLAYSYSHLFGLPATGLRFFTVYGPAGRPDMALWLFWEAILEGRPIKVFNYGDMKRDFTYIDDIVEAVLRLVTQSAALRTAQEQPPSYIYNVGNNAPEQLLDLIGYLEEFAGKPARRELLPMQPGDLQETYADISDLMEHTGFQPQTPLKCGIKRFVQWYRSFYGYERQTEILETFC